MFRLRWLQVGGATRGCPGVTEPAASIGPRSGCSLALALLQSGCQSGPSVIAAAGSGLCGPCGFFNRVSSRVFNRSNGGCCTPGVVSDAPVEYAAPSTVVTPGTTVTPSYPIRGGIELASSVHPGSTGRVTVGLAPQPIRLSSRDRAATGSTGSSSSLPGNKTSYQTRRQDPNSRLARRPVTLPRTTVSTSEPTSRSAQALSRPAAGGPSGSDDQDPLDHLPPLDLPGEVTKSAATPPVPPAADRTATPASETDKKSAIKRESPAPAADDLDLTSGSSHAGQALELGQRRAGHQPVRCRRPEAGRRQCTRDRRPEMAGRQRLSHCSGPPRTIRGPLDLHHRSHQLGPALRRVADQSESDRSRSCRPLQL